MHVPNVAMDGQRKDDTRSVKTSSDNRDTRHDALFLNAGDTTNNTADAATTPRLPIVPHKGVELSCESSALNAKAGQHPLRPSLSIIPSASHDAIEAPLSQDPLLYTSTDIAERPFASSSSPNSSPNTSSTHIKPLPATPSLARPIALKPPPFPPQEPAITRTTSSNGNLLLRQPVPDPRSRIYSSGSSNIAQLEESAEQLSSTGSIELAIREAHQELKRSDSRRSSILAASIRQASQSRSASASTESLAPSRRDFSRQNSIIELNSAARAGFLTPNDYIMSPVSSIAGVSRQHSVSKASSAGSDVNVVAEQLVLGSQTSSTLARRGAGKSSVRSTRSDKNSLPEIAELPMTLTHHALDEADRRLASGDDHDEDEERIRASAHQRIDEDWEDVYGVFDPNMPPWDHWEQHPALGSSASTDSVLLSSTSPYGQNFQDFPNQHFAAPGIGPPLPPPHEPRVANTIDKTAQAEPKRPTTAGSGNTYQQAQTAFHDFDGTHCDPETITERLSRHSPSISEHLGEHLRMPSPLEKDRPMSDARKSAYFDPETGQKMVYYPAPVPAMLNLPPKLSKKPKTAEMNARRSEVISMIMTGSDAQGSSEHVAESPAWLPDSASPYNGTGFMNANGTLSPSAHSSSCLPNPLSAATSAEGSLQKSPTVVASDMVATVSPHAEDENSGGANDKDRPSDKRKSRISILKLPPRLRASAYFDFPSKTPAIELKNGSATATLDSILDAAVSAPVSAFTDHVFAGHLGSEVYGAEKKRNRMKATKSSAQTSASSSQNFLPTSKSRASLLSFVGIRKVAPSVAGDNDTRSELNMEKTRRGHSRDLDGEAESPGLSDRSNNSLAIGDDEQLSDDSANDKEGEGEAEDDIEDFEGAPTTLLAELQLRKRQQKLRTRPITEAFPNGMHSTLLEMDTVAEIERKARQSKRISLAWEGANGDSDDDEVPLGVLYAAKMAGHNDISAAAADMRRPLGLLERRELEENEPLSRRRDRLQGRELPVSMYLGTSASCGNLKRQSMLTLTPALVPINSAAASRNARNSHSPADGDSANKDGSEAGVEEVEDEPLAARLRRIKAKEESELPRARPVSMAFSEELLSHFVDPEEEAGKRQEELDKEKARARATRGGEEETLGQRRRRLQAEKDAREREMGGNSSGLAMNGQALHALTGSNRLSCRLSMADILAAHPRDSMRGTQNPHETERAWHEQEAVRVAREQEQKIAAMRRQMPRNISSTSLGGGVMKPGGYRGGLFNDGLGGLGSASMAHHNGGQGVGLWANPGVMGGPMLNASAVMLTPSATMGTMGGMGMGMNGMNGMDAMGFGGASFGSGLNTMGVGMGYGGGYAMPQQPMMAPVMGNNGMPPNGAFNGYAGMGMPMPMLKGMPMGMPMQPRPQGQVDRVERWRQSVQP